jgi:hypothetical protein
MIEVRVHIPSFLQKRYKECHAVLDSLSEDDILYMPSLNEALTVENEIRECAISMLTHITNPPEGFIMTVAEINIVCLDSPV